jgi:hypothetical protein
MTRKVKKYSSLVLVTFYRNPKIAQIERYSHELRGCEAGNPATREKSLAFTFLTHAI